ncbi:EamA family transporter [Paenibacillus allorhizosphaerae]|uniref:Inner membrane transporter YedA n=1 Tax=Paenibacillus allorhizosphaerae TaxID=2849866 RepID=A0ABN7TNB9_9BACL|nr:EamA family transporter [Paenibacillus allorhizosphaerae]CAG7639186.1 putative inner membrane transporter YedA [Paenibacillus allorhizosphaerae]
MMTKNALPSHQEGSPSGLRFAAALVSLWLLWGSVFLALKVVITEIPPYLTGFRFIICGALLLLWCLWRMPAAAYPTGKQWGNAALVGALLIAGGQGMVIAGAQTLSSGVTSLLVSTMPLWTALLDWGMFRNRPKAKASVGLLLGFVGLVILIAPSGQAALNPLGVGCTLSASLLTAVGTIALRRTVQPGVTFSTAIQMTTGGMVIMMVSLTRGEFAQFSLSALSGTMLIATIYLLFVTVTGFLLYSWLQRNSVTATLPNTVSYISPVVAVLLGCTVLGEPLSLRMIGAIAIILSGVAVILLASGKTGSRPASHAREERFINSSTSK